MPVCQKKRKRKKKKKKSIARKRRARACGRKSFYVRIILDVAKIDKYPVVEITLTRNYAHIFR